MEPANTLFMNPNEFKKVRRAEYRFDVVELPESLKVAGVPKYYAGIEDFVDEYFVKYDSVMKESPIALQPYTVICVWSSLLGEPKPNSWESGDRIWGCLVNSLENLPEGFGDDGARENVGRLRNGWSPQ